MSSPHSSGNRDAALDQVLAKLEPADRQVVLDALDAADKTETELRYLADHDPLTALLNRRAFRTRLDTYFNFAARYGGRGAVMVIDVDGLKAVNDRLGHQQGDNLIRRVADMLRERVRATDIVARLSGDEFAVLMPQSDVEGALAARRGPARAGRRTGSPATRTWPGRRSASGSRCSAPSPTVAPRRCWPPPTRRCTGRRRRVATASRCSRRPDAARSARGQTTSAKIRNALTQNRLSLATQPIQSLSDGAVERFELLLRMRGDGGELLPAAAFIGVAERSGMVQELDRWVVGQALEMLGERERAGDPVSLHVNLSGASLTDISVLEYIERRLDEGDADPGRCTFEITQTARVEDFETAAGFADRLTEFGCEVAIDDYGAGFGPFEYLKRFPFDVIKIDGTFVRDLPRNDADQLTVKAIVGIARGLGKRTIAEFVEDEATAQMLREYGVDMAQGYHLGPPVGVDEGLAA